jgi:NTE family protein
VEARHLGHFVGAAAKVALLKYERMGPRCPRPRHRRRRVGCDSDIRIHGSARSASGRTEQQFFRGTSRGIHLDGGCGKQQLTGSCREALMMEGMPLVRPASYDKYDKKVGLVLQGGGALGSYQAGVYEALASSEHTPDWVAGISIGAINAAIIAGNAPKDRVDRLRSFWQEITAPTAMWPQATGMFAAWQRWTSAAMAIAFGQPGFFSPSSGWRLSDSLSYYSTSALRATLERFVDFDRINAGKGIRLSVGAVDVETGNFAYFDSGEMRIGAEHVMASAALPPGFPPVEIDGAQYWDGGLFSNTPLQYMVDYYPRRSRLIFQVDLFPGHARRLPTNLDEVHEREKDIRYSSRTRLATDTLRRRHDVRHAINELHKLLPPEIANTEQAKRLYSYGCITTLDIVQLIYRPDEPQGWLKDFEFSRPTMEQRWRQGLADARVTLQTSPWLAPMPSDVGVRVFDVIHQILTDNPAVAEALPSMDLSEPDRVKKASN